MHDKFFLGLFSLGACLATMGPNATAQESPELTGLEVQATQLRIVWGSELDRYIVESFDPMTGEALAVGTSSGTVESAAQIPLPNSSPGFYRLRAGLQAVRLLDEELDQAIRAVVGEAKTGPTNWLYDVDTRSITNLTVALRGVTTLDGLADLDDLTWFDLGGNQLSSLDDLAACPDLQVLRVDGNQLSSVEGIEALTDLRVLDISHNQLENIDPVAALDSLETLYADQNQLASADFAASLLNLHTLDLSGNQITTIAPLLQNAQQGGLGTGDEVYFSGNPLVDLGEVAALRGYGVTVYFP